MPGLIADENFNWDVVRQLRLRNPAWDVVSVQEVGLTGASDSTVLERATRERRILLTHDIRTIPGFVYERIGAGMATCGVVLVPTSLSVGRTISDIELVVERTSPEE